MGKELTDIERELALDLAEYQVESLEFLTVSETAEDWEVDVPEESYERIFDAARSVEVSLAGPKVLFYGASDDLVEFEGYIEEEFYFNVPNKEKWEGYLLAPDGAKLYLSAEFDSSEGWVLSTRHIASPPSSWHVRFDERPGHAYDPAILITVPSGTVLKEVTSD